MKLWMKKDHGSSLGLVLIFVTIAGMWLGAILLLLQVTSNGPSLTNNEATAAAKVTAGVLDQLKNNSSIGSAAVSKVKCTGLTVPSTSGYTVTCVPVAPAGNAGSPAGIVTTGTGANPGVDFGTTVTGPLTFDNGLTSTGPITVDPAAVAPTVTPNQPTSSSSSSGSGSSTSSSGSGCSSDRSHKNANSGKKNSNSSNTNYYTGSGSSSHSWNNSNSSSSNSWNNSKYYTTGSNSGSYGGSESGSGHSYGQDGSEYVTDHCGDQGADGEEEGSHSHHGYGDHDCDIRGAACSDDDESEEASDHSAKTVTSVCSGGNVTISLTAGDYDSTDVVELNKFLNPGTSNYSTTSGSGCKPSTSNVTVTLGDGEYQFSGSQALILNNAKALVKNANATMTGRTCTYAGGLSALPVAKGVLQSKLHGVLLNMAINMTITAGEMDLCGLNTPTGLNYALRNITPTQAATVTSREGASYAPIASASYNTLTVGANGTLRIVGAVDAQWTSFQFTQNATNPSFITQMAIFKAAHLTTVAASVWSVPYGPGSGREVQITLVNTKTGAKKSFIVFVDDVNGASVGKSTKILSSTI